jgi:hypothetical protein
VSSSPIWCPPGSPPHHPQSKRERKIEEKKDRKKALAGIGIVIIQIYTNITVREGFNK